MLRMQRFVTHAVNQKVRAVPTRHMIDPALKHGDALIALILGDDSARRRTHELADGGGLRTPVIHEPVQIDPEARHHVAAVALNVEDNVFVELLTDDRSQQRKGMMGLEQGWHELSLELREPCARHFRIAPVDAVLVVEIDPTQEFPEAPRDRVHQEMRARAFVADDENLLPHGTS